RWLIFFMAEYGSMFAISGIAVLLFLGGWHTGLLREDPAQWLYDAMGGSTWGWFLGNVLNVSVFIVKGWVLVFVMMWVRWTLPRLRIDQVMMTCIKYLVPISCALLLLVSIWQLLAAEYTWLNYTRYILAFASLAVVLLTTINVLRPSATPPTQMMPGAW